MQVGVAVELFAVADPSVVFGNAQLWFRFQVPMERAFRLHRQRLKATRALQGEMPAADRLSAGVANALVIEVESAHVTAFSCPEGREAPSLYASYRFGSADDRVSATVPRSRAPQFQDRNVVFVRETAELVEFLQRETLAVLLVDDEDPNESAFFGVARVPLHPLVSGQSLATSVPVLDTDERQVGELSLSLSWQRPFAGSAGAAGPRNRDAAALMEQPLRPLAAGRVDVLDGSASSQPPPLPPLPPLPERKAVAPIAVTVTPATPVRRAGDLEVENLDTTPDTALAPIVEGQGTGAIPLRLPMEEETDRAMASAAETATSTVFSGSDTCVVRTSCLPTASGDGA